MLTQRQFNDIYIYLLSVESCIKRPLCFPVFIFHLDNLISTFFLQVLFVWLLSFYIFCVFSLFIRFIHFKLLSFYAFVIVIVVNE